jgi:hypothetical protein
MKILTILLIGFTSLLFTSCVTTYKGGYSAKPNITIDYQIKAELDIDSTKVLQATSTTKVYFGLFRKGDNTYSDAFGGLVGDREKSAATYKALDGTGNDIIINPRYIVTVRNGIFVDVIEATVVGYGAKIFLFQNK